MHLPSATWQVLGAHCSTCESELRCAQNVLQNNNQEELPQRHQKHSENESSMGIVSVIVQ